MKEKGFSLIEVIIVLAIIAVSVSLVTPSLSRLSKTMELKGAAKRVSGILRYCRNEAIQRGQDYQIVFNPESREITARRIEVNANEAVQRVFSLPKAIDLKEIEAGSPQHPSDLPAIEFYPNGGSNGGRIVLESGDRKGYGIKVHFLTGIVTIESI